MSLNTIIPKLSKICLVESAFVEDNELVFFAVFHTKGCDREDDLLPRKLAYFGKGQDKVSVCLVYCELVCLICEGGIVKI